MSHVAQTAAATLFGVWLVAVIAGTALGMKARRKVASPSIDQPKTSFDGRLWDRVPAGAQTIRVSAEEIRRVLNGEESQ
jgi:hypothetical protein